MSFIIGKKLGMTQVYNEKGEAFPVTLVEAGPCVVTDIKNKKRDGYDAVQFGFERLPDKKIKKSKRTKPYRHIKERVGESGDVAVKDEVTVSVFSEGDKVRVRSSSKGKGFAGVMKRWNFSGAGTSSHGTKHNNRKGGSIGSMYPQRVFKGKKMAGRMGGENVTVKNLTIIKVDPEKNIIAIGGALPGKNGGVLTVEKI
jgi:large subunit ribosomal protein L3